MSEKAACPRCDSYASEVYYDSRHSWCGWNCHVEFESHAYGPAGHAVLVTTAKPTTEQRTALARLVGASSASASVLVDGSTPERLSPWLDPDQADPAPLNERKRKANLKALRDQRLEDAREAIDRDLPDG